MAMTKLEVDSQSGATLKLAGRRRRSRSNLWANRDFVNFWMGETVSLFGTQLTALALPLTAVLTLHATAPQVGILRFSQFAPFLALPLIFGLWADRRRRIPLMIWANGARAALIGAVAALALIGHLDLGLLYVLVFVIGAFSVLFDVCWMAALPTLVSDRELLLEANSKVGVSYSAAEVAGPGLGGVLVQAFTAPFALLIDACSYVFALVSLLAIRVREEVPTASATPRRGLAGELGDGLRFVGANPYLRVIAFLGAAFNFFFIYIEAIFILYAVRSLSLSAAVVGAVLSASAVGGVAGSMVAPRLTRRFSLGAVYSGAVVIGFSSLLLIPAAAGPRWVMVIMFVAGFFLTATGIGAANVVSFTMRQTITPNRMLGRMTAAMRMLTYGLGALGGLVSGFVAASVGLRAALLLAAAGCTLSVLALLFSPIPQLRALPSVADDE
jgi:MFS family permease